MNTNTTVSFPGLGIEEFIVDRVAFSVFGKDVYWYGVIIMLGMLAAFLHAYLRSKQERITADDLMDVGIWTVLVGVVGARLYYVLTTFKDGGYHSFLDVIAVWEGGLAIYGGIIGGALAILIVTRLKKLNTLKVMDAIAPGVMIAQAIGRWGNFVNGEAFGRAAEEGSFLYRFRMTVSSHFTGYETVIAQPTFLYESVWNIVGFILITCFYKKKKFNGQILLSYLTWYGFGRMFIEGLRTDSLWVGPFRISQIVGAVCFVCGASAMIAGLLLIKKGKFERWLRVDWTRPAAINSVPEEYVPVFTSVETDAGENAVDTTISQEITSDAPASEDDTTI